MDYINRREIKMNMEFYQSNDLKEIAVALVELQSKIKPAPKKSENPYYHSRYADLTTVWDSVRDFLKPCGLAVIQTFSQSDINCINITTTLLHSSGQYLRGVLTLPILKPDPQAAGAAITYGRRYSLSAILGITFDEPDDDAETAMHRDKKAEEWIKKDEKAYQQLVDAEQPYSPLKKWQDVEIHFGKNKGVKLGDLSRQSLKWYRDEWEPRPKDDGTLWDSDVRLADALKLYKADRDIDKAHEELKKNKQNESDYVPF
jgi:hypothetical protein